MMASPHLTTSSTSKTRKSSSSSSIHLVSLSSPHSFFRPTRATLHLHDHTGRCDDAKGPGTFVYNSRQARKGRLVNRSHHVHAAPGFVEEKERELEYHARLRLKSLETRFKPGLTLDISFWVAVIFTLGSIVWVVNSFTVVMPNYLSYIADSPSLTTTYYKTSAALAFIGGTLFELGSYLMVVEALNRGRENDFGPSLEELLWDSSSPSSSSKAKFLWWGKPLWHDLGYLAAVIQLFAATVFWISTITGLPGVIPGYPTDSNVAITDVFFWTPQVIGGWGFIISSALLMLEVQKVWYLPALGDIGWHIGLWNFIGGVGFMICGAMGYNPAEWWVKQSGWSTFWGSWAFLIGSCMQVWETVWREPDDKDDDTKEV